MKKRSGERDAGHIKDPNVQIVPEVQAVQNVQAPPSSSNIEGGFSNCHHRGQACPRSPT